MNERFLHYLWQHKYFYGADLKSASGEPIRILAQGTYNTDGGPDFLNAKVKIGQIEWAGNVEIHLKASDWFRHDHHQNPAYNNIILHVVYEADAHIKRTSGEPIPALELKGRFDESLSRRFQQMMQSVNWIACGQQIAEVPRITFELWLERLLIERIEEKTEQIGRRLEQNGFNWEHSFYESVASSFGLKVNALPFELLAKSIPFNTLNKHSDNLFQIEALLFGQAGMLEVSFNDEYPKKLKQEYRFLQSKYRLTPIDPAVWNFLRLRPSSFPTHRIAQLAMLMSKTKSLFSYAVVDMEKNDLFSTFQVDTSEYWHKHYLFDKEAKVKSHTLGPTMVQLIVINSVIPFMFMYGKYYGKETLIKKALDLHDLLPAEDNAVIREFKQLNVNTATAFRTQSLLQLKKRYCDKKKCLDCAIGNFLIKPRQ